jgi:hypothetical protein
MSPEGILKWSREVSVVPREALTEDARRKTGAVMPEEQLPPARLPLTFEAAKKAPIIAVAPKLVPKLVDAGVRVHTVGLDRLTSSFFYIAEGGGEEGVQVTGDLVQAVAEMLGDRADNAAIERTMDGIADRLLRALSRDRITELGVELAASLPRLASDGSGTQGLDLEAFERDLKALVGASEKYSRMLQDAANKIAGASGDRVDVPLYTEARKVSHGAFDLTVGDHKISLPAYERWVMSGPFTDPAAAPPAPAVQPVEAKPVTAAQPVEAKPVKATPAEPTPAPPATKTKGSPPPSSEPKAATPKPPAAAKGTTPQPPETKPATPKPSAAAAKGTTPQPPETKPATPKPPVAAASSVSRPTPAPGTPRPASTPQPKVAERPTAARPAEKRTEPAPVAQIIPAPVIAVAGDPRAAEPVRPAPPRIQAAPEEKPEPPKQQEPEPPKQQEPEPPKQQEPEPPKVEAPTAQPAHPPEPAAEAHPEERPPAAIQAVPASEIEARREDERRHAESAELGPEDIAPFVKKRSPLIPILIVIALVLAIVVYQVILSKP